MENTMEQQLVAVGAQPCVWMCAGLVSYRLCSRDFDCEHCPLDAALRGELPPVPQGRALLYRPDHGNGLPTDRRYSSGHTWAQRTAEESRIWRVGIDAFAATLIGCVRGISCEPFEHLAVDAPLCTIDMGVGALTIGAPFSGHVMHHNEALAALPDLLITSPFTDGWIAELMVDDASNDALLEPDAARRQLTLDLRRFRRNIAFRLLAATATGERSAGGLEEFSDLRNVIAGDHYVDCIRDFVH
jgi:glycine cleavage system H lipoate-binding protein